MLLVELLWRNWLYFLRKNLCIEVIQRKLNSLQIVLHFEDCFIKGFHFNENLVQKLIYILVVPIDWGDSLFQQRVYKLYLSLDQRFFHGNQIRNHAVVHFNHFVKLVNLISVFNIIFVKADCLLGKLQSQLIEVLNLSHKTKKKMVKINRESVVAIAS